MGTGEITYAWAPITKAERQEDGSVIVTGPMTDAGLDRDGQGMNQAWLDEVAPKWFEESGNIREQHDKFKAAGVGIGLHRQANGTFVLQSRIVDPVAAMKCLPGPNGERPVYQGYSIGIREPRVSFQKAEFPGGEVVGGYICETSLADRPSNPRMLFTMVKADGDGNPIPGDGEHEVDGQDGQDGVTRDKPKGHKEPDGDEGQGLPGDGDGDEDEVSKAQEPELRKDWAEFDAKRAAGRVGRDVTVGHGGDPRILPGDHARSVKVGDIAAAHHEGKTIIGHVAEIHGGSHVTIQHAGGTTKVPREAVAPLRVADPPKAQDQGMGTIKGVTSKTPPVDTAKELSPEAHHLAQTRREHHETENEAGSALGAGMFDAAIRQAKAAAARHAAATKAEVPDLFKFVSAKQRAKYADSGVAMPNGDFPIADHNHLTAALRLLSRYKGDQAAAKAHIKTRAKALGVDVDLDGPDSAEKLAAIADLTKAVGWIVLDMIEGPEAAQLDKTDEVEAMDKAELQAMITAAVTDGLKGIEERTGEQIAALVGRVEKVEAAPAPGGPVQTRAPGQTLLAKNREVKAVQEQIADLDATADLYKTENPTLASGYRQMADDLRAQLTTRS